MVAEESRRQLFYDEGVLPKPISSEFGVAALLRSAILQRTNVPRFAEAQLQQTPLLHLAT
jgi:hypothetical protein